MATFNPSEFTAPTPKPLPVILLLDISGSMAGAKIENLNSAVKEMLHTFSDTQSGESDIRVAIITFGGDVRLHQSLASVADIQWRDLSASGGTPLGTALRMAKAMIEDKDVIPSRAYRPVVVLVSDGQPTDSWEGPLDEFVSTGRSAKCDRMAMAIGADADEAVLGKFIAGTKNQLFYAENARQLREFFKFVTMSVTVRSRSQDPNITPAPSAIQAKPTTIDSRKSTPRPVSPKADRSVDEPSTEGYW